MVKDASHLEFVIHLTPLQLFISCFTLIIN